MEANHSKHGGPTANVVAGSGVKTGVVPALCR